MCTKRRFARSVRGAATGGMRRVRRTRPTGLRQGKKEGRLVRGGCAMAGAASGEEPSPERQDPTGSLPQGGRTGGEGKRRRGRNDETTKRRNDEGTRDGGRETGGPRFVAAVRRGETVMPLSCPADAARTKPGPPGMRLGKKKAARRPPRARGMRDGWRSFRRRSIGSAPRPSRFVAAGRANGRRRETTKGTKRRNDEGTRDGGRETGGPRFVAALRRGETVMPLSCPADAARTKPGPPGMRLGKKRRRPVGRLVRGGCAITCAASGEEPSPARQDPTGSSSQARER